MALPMPSTSITITRFGRLASGLNLIVIPNYRSGISPQRFGTAGIVLSG